MPKGPISDLGPTDRTHVAALDEIFTQNLWLTKIISHPLATKMLLFVLGPRILDARCMMTLHTWPHDQLLDQVCGSSASHCIGGDILVWKKSDYQSHHEIMILDF